MDTELLVRHLRFCVADYALVAFDLDGRITFWNKGAEAIFAYSAAEMLGSSGARLFTPQDRADGYPGTEMRLAQRDGRAADFRWHIRRDGALFWADGVLTPVHDQSGALAGFMKVLRDVTESKLAHDRAEHMASFDLLTGLANRMSFNTRLAEMLSLAERGNQWLLLFAIDLDRFKEVNDHCGHGAGDALLKEAAHRLTQACRESDVIARLGGDEFALLQLNPPSISAGAALADKLLAALAAPFDLDGHVVSISGSIGIAVYPSDACNTHDLRSRADLALYQAKKAGRNCFHYFTDAMDDAIHQRKLDKIALQETVANDTYRIAYQPIVNAATGATVAMEALIRFTDPRLSAQPVEHVIDLAREMGLIAALGAGIFRQVCLQLKQWNDLGMRPVRVAVNTCANELLEPAYIATLAQTLADCDVDPAWIDIELTERDAIALNGNSEPVLDVLHGMGFRIALDDFGTGYSSLSYLRGLPIDSIKLDRSFVHDVPDRPDANKVVGAVIALAHALDLTVTAEGVETAGQASFLQACRCQYLQGYLFSRALSPNAATQWLARGGGVPPA